MTKADADFRDDSAKRNMAALLSRPTEPYSDEALKYLADTAYNAAEALLAARAERYGAKLPANKTPTFELPDDDDLDEPVSYRPATNPPPAEEVRECFAYPPASLDELEPASGGTRETDPAPAPNESGTVVAASAEQEGGSDIDASWGAVTDARGPLRQCDEGECGCHAEERR